MTARTALPPTRMALGRVKRQLAAARRGHKLLKDKRDELMRRLLALMEESRGLRQEVEAQLFAYYRAMAAARAEMGQAAWQTALFWPGQRIGLETESRKAMNVPLPIWHMAGALQPALCGETAALADGMQKLASLWPGVLRLAETEEAARRLAGEIERTRRRVNALEHLMIPRLEQTQRRIRMQLEENDRANNTRLLKVKDLVLQSAHKQV